MPKLITAVYDNVAEQIIGGLYLHSHKAPAIRMFGDIATMPNSQLALHPEDFDLILVGQIADDGGIIDTTREIILTGETWSAAQKPHLEETDIAS